MRNALNGHAVGLSESWRKILGKKRAIIVQNLLSIVATATALLPK